MHISTCIDHLVALMGTDSNDSLSIPSQFWGRPTGRFQSVAFYPRFAVPQGDGRILRFVDVVESVSGPNTFAAGLSGTGWATDLPSGTALIMAMQSYAATNGTRSVGTHF